LRRNYEKFFIVVLLAALVAGAVFAQVADGIEIGGLGRAAFAPLIIEGAKKNIKGEDDKDSGGVYMGTGVNWEANSIDAEIDITGNGGDYAGFQLKFATGGNGDDDDPFNVFADRYNIWVQPSGSPVFKLIGRRF